MLMVVEYSSEQHYLVMFLQFGGTDLEHTSVIDSSSKIRSVLLQIILALGQGEEQCNFEVFI
jgi:hypothetical protein